MIDFIIGCVVGGLLGVAVMCLIICSKKGD